MHNSVSTRILHLGLMWKTPNHPDRRSYHYLDTIYAQLRKLLGQVDHDSVYNDEVNTYGRAPAHLVYWRCWFVAGTLGRRMNCDYSLVLFTSPPAGHWLHGVLRVLYLLGFLHVPICVCAYRAVHRRHIFIALCP